MCVCHRPLTVACIRAYLFPKFAQMSASTRTAIHTFARTYSWENNRFRSACNTYPNMWNDGKLTDLTKNWWRIITNIYEIQPSEERKWLKSENIWRFEYQLTANSETSMKIWTVANHGIYPRCVVFKCYHHIHVCPPVSRFNWGGGRSQRSQGINQWW